jgi:lipid-A-disaccharide synthase
VPLTAGTGQPTLFVSACEASADLHGARVMQALRARAPGARFVGIGGDRMVAAGLEPVFHARDLSVMGVSEVLGRLATIRRAFARARACMAAERPGAALLIDAPDFNLRLARHAREAGVRVIEMIPPKVWAWRRGRLKTIARRVDHVLVILPFEPPIYEAAGVPVTYVGNPLVDEMHEAEARAPDGVRWRPADLGLSDGRPLVGLLPGSRPGEIAAILPRLLEAGRLLAERLPEVQFAVPVAGSLDVDTIRAEVDRSGLSATCDVTCIDGRAVELLLAADAVAMASGTVTLQAALAGVPGVIVYRAAPLTYAIGSRLVRVPHFGLTNLVAGRRVVPELLQGQFTPEAVCGLLHDLLTRPDVAEAQRKALEEVRSRLGPPGAAARAAEAVLGILEKAA